jgi:hypothetical protein
MRSSVIAIAIGLAGLAAPMALACTRQEAPEDYQGRPSLFWPRPPDASELAPGEIAIRVKFLRSSDRYDPTELEPEEFLALHGRTPEEIVIVSCYGHAIYTTLDVLAGEFPAGSTNVLMAPSQYAHAAQGQDLILVGKLYRLSPTAHEGAPGRQDSPRYLIVPRLQVQ